MDKKPRGKLLLYPSENFVGACIDSGADKSVMGYEQARDYCTSKDANLDLVASPLRFKFRNSTHRSEGTMEVRIQITGEAYIAVNTDVVRADLPPLIGLEILSGHTLILNFADRSLQQLGQDWKIPMKFSNGHVFLQWPTLHICFPKAELERLNQNFLHPSTGKLFALLRRALPAEAD